MFKRGAVLAALVTAVMWAAAAPARASYVIDFGTGTAGSGGLIQPISGGWEGSGILIDTMLASGTPVNDGVYNVDGPAAATFNANNTPRSNGTIGVLSFNTVTGDFSITGSVPDLGVLAPVTLLSGTMGSFTTGFDAGGFTLHVMSGTDTKNPALLSGLGIAAGTPFQFSGFSIAGIDNGDGTYTATSTDISNVPEPVTTGLLGLGLAGLAAARRRRRAATQA